jgi:hypothetical protein
VKRIFRSFNNLLFFGGKAVSIGVGWVRAWPCIDEIECPKLKITERTHLAK